MKRQAAHSHQLGLVFFKLSLSEAICLSQTLFDSSKIEVWRVNPLQPNCVIMIYHFGVKYGDCLSSFYEQQMQTILLGSSVAIIWVFFFVFFNLKNLSTRNPSRIFFLNPEVVIVPWNLKKGKNMQENPSTNGLIPLLINANFPIFNSGCCHCWIVSG